VPVSSAAGSERHALPWLWLSALLIAADQASKWYFLGVLEYAQPVPVIDGFWNWKLVHNHGAAFSFLADASGWQRWFFSALAVGISVLLVHWLRRLPRDHWREALPYALIIAGALGNLVDRVRFGYVVDFVHWYWRDFHWPVFNVADSAIVVGAVMLVLLALFPGARKP
jgi:signal peptidase II